MLGCSSWFRHLTFGACSLFVVSWDLVRIFKGDRRSHLTKATTSAHHLNSVLCSTGHIDFISIASCSRHIGIFLNVSVWTWVTSLINASISGFFCKPREKHKHLSRKVHPFQSMQRITGMNYLSGVPALLPAPQSKVHWLSLEQTYWRTLITL